MYSLPVYSILNISSVSRVIRRARILKKNIFEKALVHHVCPYKQGTAATGRIFVKFCIGEYVLQLLDWFRFELHVTPLCGHELKS